MPEISKNFVQKSIKEWQKSTVFKEKISAKYNTHTRSKIKDRIDFVTQNLLGND